MKMEKKKQQLVTTHFKSWHKHFRTFAKIKKKSEKTQKYINC